MQGHRPRKRFGQNFLHDSNVIERIVRLIRPLPGQALVEIGPGLGALTAPLIEAAGQLQARDQLAVQFHRLQQRFGERLQLHQADALNFDFASLAQTQALRLVGNLPYNISTPLIFHLLSFDRQIADMHFMLQKEVVDRICAAPGSKAYGRLTVTVAARAEASCLMRIGPGAFTPPPKVESAIVRLRPRPAPFAIADLGRYDALVTAAFAQRRKTLANSLREQLSVEQIEAAGIDPRLRAERLSPAEFAQLAAQQKTAC